MQSGYGHWNYENQKYPAGYGGEATTYHIGAYGLCQCKEVEDWGCGTGFFKVIASRYSPECKVVNIDGSKSKFLDIHADLAEYRSKTPAIFMRHVLEHNGCWKTILRNACESFQRMFFLVLFTPFVEETRNLYPETSKYVAYAFRKEDLTDVLDEFNLRYEVVSLKTASEFGIEHIFKITRPE